MKLYILLLLIFTLLFYIKIKFNNKIENYKNKKFFHELESNPHLDRNYAKSNIKLSNKEIIKELIILFNNLVTLCNKNNIKVILMHGTLIGWYFNRKILPWDDDIDVVILENDLKKFKILNNYETKNFIIKINPNSIDRNPKDRENVIDARIISKINGVFIDITFLTKSPNKKGFVNCKSPHYYKIKNILPLKKTNFEKINNIYVPNNYKKCLSQEYGNKVFLNNYKNFIFKNNIWIKNI